MKTGHQRVLAEGVGREFDRVKMVYLPINGAIIPSHRTSPQSLNQ